MSRPNPKHYYEHDTDRLFLFAFWIFRVCRVHIVKPLILWRAKWKIFSENTLASAAQALKSFLIKSQQEASSVLNGEDAKVNIRKKYKSHDQTND